eukprot:snap_masked-scaffold_9-processed-gene-6.24-mRNA-1 protein AED:1.00 eAED:1.00 QI:0/-1/0/0/-1/1/1/0/175
MSTFYFFLSLFDADREDPEDTRLLLGSNLDFLTNETSEEKKDHPNEESWEREYFWLLIMISAASALLALVTYSWITDNSGSGQNGGPEIRGNNLELMEENQPPKFPWGMKVKEVFDGEHSLNQSGFSFVSMYSRRSLPFMSGRYSGKFEAMEGKDDALETLAREKRKKQNIEGKL